MAPPDLSTARPPSTRPVRSSPVLCTRSPTPATVLVAARHAAPATCTTRDKQTRFSERNKGKRKTKQNYPEFEFKHRQVNDSSHSNTTWFLRFIMEVSEFHYKPMTQKPCPKVWSPIPTGIGHEMDD
jgi:hypothetical protein